MAQSVLSRYLNPEVLSRVADQHIEPKGLVIGNLAGAHRSPLSGFAVEFAGHREYVPGDDPKHVDWRVYFTRDKYFVKQYELETNFVCHLVLDVSASMRYGEHQQQKLLYAAQMATTLGYSIVRQSDKVSLATFDDRLRGRSLTTINSAVFFGVGLTQLVTGNLIDAFPGEGGAHPEIAYRAMFIYVACVGFLGVGIYARFSRRGGGEFRPAAPQVPQVRTARGGARLRAPTLFPAWRRTAKWNHPEWTVPPADGGAK